jgi:hypothetical protein
MPLMGTSTTLTMTTASGTGGHCGTLTHGGDAMEALRHAMLTIRNDLAKAVRAAGLWYHEPAGSAARAKRAS